MKRPIPWLALLLFFLPFNTTFQSCKNVSEEPPFDLTGENFFQNDDAAVRFVGKGYSHLNGFYFFGTLALQELTTDEMVQPFRGISFNYEESYHQFHKHTYTPDERVLYGNWNFFYDGIEVCNGLISEMERVGRNNLQPFISEVKVLRALYYFWLIDLYGNVPIITKFENAEVPRNSSRKEVFDFIENEITENADFLSKKTDPTTYGRITYFAAQALLAKLYLNAEVYTGEPAWPKAVAACNAIINAGNYKLDADFFGNFKLDNENSPESVFAIPYEPSANHIFFFAHLASLHSASVKAFGLPYNIGYDRQVCTLEDFFLSYTEEDIRKKGFLFGPQFEEDGVTPVIDTNTNFPLDPDGPPLNYTPHITSFYGAFMQDGVRFTKFELPYKTNGIANREDFTNDFPVFRYADILMMKAEALWRINPADGEALALVNQIRERAGVPPFDQITAENLLAERGREFFIETWRRNDLIRFGKYNDAWWEKPADPDVHVNIFPIPETILEENPNLVQNPGY